MDYQGKPNMEKMKFMALAVASKYEKNIEKKNAPQNTKMNEPFFGLLNQSCIALINQ